MCLAVLITELANCRGYRDRATFLKIHWEWIVEHAISIGIEHIPSEPPVHTTIWRFCTSFDQSALTQLYLAELRQFKIQQQKSDIENDDPKPFAKFVLPHFAMDGKARSGCISIKTGRTEMDLTLLDVEGREVLGLMTLPDKKGEATQAQTFFKMYGKELPRGIVTFDAGITGPKTIKAIRNADHEYIAAIKGNAGYVYSIAENYPWDRAHYSVSTSEKGHGRFETRSLWFLPVSAFPKGAFKKYKDCGYVIKVESTRTIKDEATTEIRYFVGSKGLKGNQAIDFLRIIRGHWVIENGLHWVKDAVLGEDDMPKETHKASRFFGFLKSMVVAIGYQFCKSVKQFSREFGYQPNVMFEKILHQSL